MSKADDTRAAGGSTMKTTAEERDEAQAAYDLADSLQAHHKERADALQAQLETARGLLRVLVRWHNMPPDRHDHETDGSCEPCTRWDSAAAFLGENA